MEQKFILIVGVIVFISVIAAGIIAKKIHDTLMHSGNKNYVGLSVLGFLASFLGIGFLLYLVAYAFFL